VNGKEYTKRGKSRVVMLDTREASRILGLHRKPALLVPGVGAHAGRLSRWELASTVIEESAIAPAATIGCSRPAAASGSATAL
jgi:hypothetical protein